MKTSPRAQSPSLRPGLSLIELTVVIAVLLVLATVLFLGVKAYQAGSDRASCVLNIYNYQTAVRSYSNLNGLVPGQALHDSRDLQTELVGPDRFVQADPSCPGGGKYSHLGNRIPGHGELYLTCSLAGNGRHVPRRIESW